MTSSAVLTRFRSLFLLILTFSTVSFADYAWIPKYANLWTKLGFDYTSSKENIGSDGARNDITYQSRLVDFTEYRFWVEAEYGIARDISSYIRPNFLWNSINPITGSGTGFPSKGGLSDVYIGFKWNPVKGPLLFTPELMTKIPAYGTGSLAADELALGDGDFSIGAIGHLGYRANKHFAFGLSPGALYRSSNYKAQLLFGGMTAFMYNPLFVRLFVDWKISIGKEVPPALVTDNAEPGSGSTFARLSKNQDLLAVGAKFGIKFHDNYRFDINYQQSLGGNSAPYYWQLGVNFFAPFDFYHEEKKIKVKEVPFDSEQPPENG